jgi:hypothetical protein
MRAVQGRPQADEATQGIDVYEQMMNTFAEQAKTFWKSMGPAGEPMALRRVAMEMDDGASSEDESVLVIYKNTPLGRCTSLLSLLTFKSMSTRAGFSFQDFL